MARAKALADAHPNSVFLELSDSEDGYQWKVNNNYPFKLISLFYGRKLESIPGFELHINVIKSLNKIKPDIVIFPGFMKYGFRTIALWAKVRGIPAILHIDSWHGDKPRKEWKQRLKGIM